MDLHRDENPMFLNDYLTYLDVIRGRSARTVTEYYHDISLFLRWVYAERNRLSKDEIAEVKLSEISLELLKTVNVSLLYDYIRYLRDTRGNTPRS